MTYWDAFLYGLGLMRVNKARNLQAKIRHLEVQVESLKFNLHHQTQMYKIRTSMREKYLSSFTPDESRLVRELRADLVRANNKIVALERKVTS